MLTVRDILNRKGTDVVSISPTATVLDAAYLMNTRGTGSVLVTDEAGLQGIFTERDVLRRIVAGQRNPATTPVGEVMTVSVVTCRPDTPVADCMATMTARRIRRLPVLDGSVIVGLITSGDVLACEAAEQAQTIQYLNSYIHESR